MLAETDTVLENIKRTGNNEGLDTRLLQEVRDIIFVELVRSKMPYFAIPEDNIIRFRFDGKNHDLQIDKYIMLAGKKETVSILGQTDLSDIDMLNKKESAKLKKIKEKADKIVFEYKASDIAALASSIGK